jgi:hypothetical protein
MNGYGDIKGTNTMRFCEKKDIPFHKKVSYARTVCGMRPQKDEILRTRMTAGGDRLDYDGDISTDISGLNTNKIH